MPIGETSDEAKELRKVAALDEVRVLPFDEPLEVAALEEEGRRVSLPIGAFTCYGNSLVLAKMKRAQMADTWVVGGVGVRHFDDGSIAVQAHAWVRIGERHFDCTWPRCGSTDGFAYFSALELSDFSQMDEAELKTIIISAATGLGIAIED